MMIYIYSNESGNLVDQFKGADNVECENWYMENYDINDYSASYCEGKMET
jgi:hypothetical protein